MARTRTGLLSMKINYSQDLASGDKLTVGLGRYARTVTVKSVDYDYNGGATGRYTVIDTHGRKHVYCAGQKVEGMRA